MFKNFNLSIKPKIVILSVVLPLLLVASLLSIYYVNEKDKNLDFLIDKARTICLTSEAVRIEMERQWDRKIFTTEKLKKWKEEGSEDKVYNAIPVVISWNAAKLKSKEEKYVFKTPKFNPRNPNNLPNELEEHALIAMKEQNLDEYYVVESSTNTLHYFRPVFLTQTCMNCHGSPDTSQEIWGNNEGIDITGGKMEGWTVGQMHGAFEVVQGLDESDAALMHEIVKESLVALVGFGIMATIGMMVGRSLINPLTKIMNTIKKISNKDLSVEVPYQGRKDEIGSLADTVQNMLTNLKQLTSEINESTSILYEATNKFLGSISEISSSSAQTTEEVKSTQSTVSELKKIFEDSGEKAAYVDEVSKEAVKISSLGEKSVQDTVKGIQKIKEQMEAIGESIHQLNQRTDDVGGMVRSVSEITEQSKILSVNASIEAAKSGEFGKGFTVVAKQIKALAKQAKEATQEIKSRLGDIQKFSSEALSASGEGGELVEQGLDKSESSTDSIQKLLESFEKTVEAIRQVTGSSKEQLENVGRLSKAMNNVKESSVQNLKNLEEIESASKELNNLGKTLKDLVSSYKLDR